MPRQLLQKQEPVGLLIASARRRIKQAVWARVRRYRLTPPQFWVLVAVHERGGLSLGELAERQRMDQPTASRVIAALTRRKLVRVAGDPRDRRRSRLRPTAAGSALGKELQTLATEVREAVVRDLSASEQDVLRTVLRKIIANMNDFEREGREDRAVPRARVGGAP